MIAPCQRKRAWSVLFALALIMAPAQGQNAAQFEKASLSLRTALHFDPGAEAPLRSLITQYQQAGKMTELISLYLAHIAQFPNDEGAKVVLSRLYVAVNDVRAEDFIESAIAAHPQSALLAFTRSQMLTAEFALGALEELDRAIALEILPSRRAFWLGELLKAAASQQREDLAVARLAALVQDNAITPPQRVQWARRALELGLIKAAARVLAGLSLQNLEGEEGVEARFVAARVALANEERGTAAGLAVELLDILAADHWRRLEALSLRWQSAHDEAERGRLLEEAARRLETGEPSEADALAYADLLIAAGRRTDAVKALVKASVAMTASRLIEDRLLDLFEQLHQHDNGLAFVANRLRLMPEREDLALRQARWLLMLGRADEGVAAMEKLLENANETERTSTVLQTARWLRTRNLLAESARLLEVLVSRHADRWDARKELAEQLALLKRRDEVERLFERPIPDDVAPELRMEIVQFLLSQRLWPQARRELEQWVEKRPAEFDARLLLARICALQGDEAATARRLQECRDLADTEARYAAWLAAAWQRADEQEKTREFIEAERQRLWPKPDESWDAPGLARLSLVAQQTLQGSFLADAEKLVRAALTAKDLPPDHHQSLQDQLVRLLDGQKDREKDLESEIAALLQKPGAAHGDLRLRLALMYHAAQRHDLARTALEQVDADTCQDAALVGRAATVARDIGLQERAMALYERLLRLKPDDRAGWSEWTALLSAAGDEEKLRGALREISAHSVKWQLTGESQDLLRRHLAASYWRSVGRLLMAQEPRDSEIVALLNELERTETTTQRRLWAAWARGMVALHSSNHAALADVKAALAGSDEDWVDFPDGLSLSIKAAQAMLETQDSGSPTAITPPKAASTAPLQAPALAWGFATDGTANLQRWELTPDGQRVLIMDTHRMVHALDRTTGKLLWKRRMATRRALPAMQINTRGDEQITYPVEWAISNEHLCLIDESGLMCWRISDGATVWQIETELSAPLAQGSLTIFDDKTLWWRPRSGVIDAIDSQTGKLLWTQHVPPLAEAPKPVAGQSMSAWFAAGIHADAGRVLVWGNGSAVLQVADGTILWRASAARSPVSFPLELRAEDEPKPPSTQAVVFSWTAFSGMRRTTASNYRGAGMGRSILAHPLAVPSYGYHGMYGGGHQAAPWLTWGTDGTRLLRGDGIWVISQQGGIARYSAFGLPVVAQGSGGAYGYGHASPIGFAGKALIMAGESGVTRVLPDGTPATLFSISRYDNRPAAHPMPAAVLDGATLLLSTRDTLRAQDALSGTVIWEGDWPEAARTWASDGWGALDGYQSMRWSARGVSLHDVQGRTLTVDWKALAAEGDWIVPAGVKKLVCLRSDGGQTAGK